MSEVMTGSISTADAHHALQDLLDSYLSEKAEGQQDSDTYYVGYWDSACRTIYEVATALNIPFDDPWVDPSYVRSAEYQALLRTTRTGRRQCRKRQKAGSSHAE